MLFYIYLLSNHHTGHSSRSLVTITLHLNSEVSSLHFLTSKYAVQEDFIFHIIRRILVLLATLLFSKAWHIETI